MRKLLILLAALLCLGGQAGDAQPLKVIFGQSRPPFVMVEESSGLSVDLAREVFGRMGESFVPLFGSNKRMEIELRQGHVDVAVEVQPSDPELFYSQPFIAYRNYLITRRRQNIQFSGHWTDLQGVTVCAWQNAAQSLGSAFVEASKGFASYREYSSQRTQVEAWLLRNCDAILIDSALLEWQWQRLRRQNPRIFGDSDREVVQVPLPQGHELWWYVGFRSSELRDRFDVALAQIHADGSYQRLRQRYGLQ
jgi:polar amino acid transport system substrate-binding protein